MLKYLLMGAAAFFLLRTKKNAETLKDLEPFFENLRVKKFQNFNMILLIDLVVENPRKTALYFNELKADIKYGGNTIAKINRTGQNILIQKRAKTRLKNIEFKIPIAESLNEIFDIVSSKDYSNITFEGYIKADGVSFPINEKITE